MYNLRNLRYGNGLLILAALLLFFSLTMTGCSDETAPTQAVAPEPPTLPVADQLQFDFSFFDEAPQLNKASGQYDNFVNAYLRTVVLDAMARLVLAAPIGAFSAAVHTVPVAMDDGAWIWTYPWRNGDEAFDIRLRGLPVGDVVMWELSFAAAGGSEGVLWFSGTTNGDASEGHWEFRDLETAGYPVSGEINWGGTTAGGTFLEFVDRQDGADSEHLRFNDNDPDFSITFSDAASESFIRWSASGAGSLQVPDYNDGLQACWGTDLRNTDCR